MRGIAAELRAAGLRVECMDQPGHMNKKIKEAQHRQIPFMAIAGDREAVERTLAIRRRGTREQEPMAVADFVALVRRLVEERSLALE